MDVEKTLAEMLSLMQTGYKQTRDGSHLKEENVQKQISSIKEQLTNKITSLAESIPSQSSIQNNINNLTNTLSQLGISGPTQQAIIADRNKQLQNARADEIQHIENYIKLRDKAEREYRNHIRKESKENVYSALTNGRNYKFIRQGEAISELGNSIQSLGGGKMGGLISSFGKGIGKLAGPLAILQMACDAAGKAMQMFGDYLQHEARQIQFANQRQNIKQETALGLTQLAGEEIISEAQSIITQAKSEISSKAALAVEGNQIVQNAKAAAVETGLKSLTDIADGAFAAASQKIDIDASVAKFNNKMQSQESIISAQKQFAQQQIGLTRQNIAAKAGTILTGEDTSLSMNYARSGQEGTQYFLNTTLDMMGSMSQMAQPITNGAKSIIDGFYAVSNANLEGINQEKMYQAKLNETRTGIRTTLQGMANDFAMFGKQTIAEMNQSIYDAKADAEAREQKAWLNFTQTIFNAFQKSETAAYQMGRAFGYNKEQLYAYAKKLSQTQITVSQWGKNMEDMMNLQSSYQETTGRNTLFSENDFNKSFANGLLMGDDVISKLNAGMEPFNKSVADSNEMFYEMYRNVTKMGMSGKKYAKDLINNLKLAEKYNFKGGVKSLMEMSKWAQNVRFNTGSIDSMLDKVQEGGLEGIIKQSAELQVLGGNFAMGSDPLAMAYESFMDPEGYAKRMNGMIAGQGVMDSETGEVSFGIASQLAMRQMAKSTGQNYEDVLAQAKQQVKVNKMKDLVSQSFNDDQMAAIANNAKYENGEWVVNTQNGVKSVSSLTAEDISTLSGGDDPTKTMDENIASMRSTQELMKATQDNISATLQNSQWDTFRDCALQMIDNVQTHFNENIPEYVNNIQEKMEYVVDAQRTMVHQIMGQDSLSTTIAAVQAAAEQLRQSVVGAINTTNGILQSLIGQLGAKFSEAEAQAKVDNTNTDFNAILKKVEGMGGFTKAVNQLSNTNSAWYDDEMKDIMNRLRANPTGLNTINDASRKAQLAKLIYMWDDSGWTTDFDFKGDEKLYNYFIKDLAKNNPRSVFNPAQNKFGGAKGFKNMLPTTQQQNGEFLSKNPVSNDGLILQNGRLTQINSQDQVLAAKNGGPLDKMLDMIQPRSIPYNSHVNETPYNMGGGSNNGEIKIAPISITINGSINVNGSSMDLSSQIQNDPQLKTALWGFISNEVAKRVGNTGKTINPIFNRIQNIK